MRLAVALLALTISATYADLYLNGCFVRGSNDRCDEESNNRRNANRLFNSQNNAAGGYGVDSPVPMYFYVGTKVVIEWTTQHGCGDQGKAECDLILQYTHDAWSTDPAANEGPVRNGLPDPNGHNDNNNNADGTCTNTINNNDRTNIRAGRHESFTYYNDCNARERNGGLFTADQNVQNNQGAQATRQNPGGTRYGTECQEERDYFPYWHPTAWRDIAVLTTNLTKCPYYQAESQNVKPKNYCTDNTKNNEFECPAGQWLEAPAHGIDAPVCEMAPWQRDNHLGSTNDGYPAQFNWTIPNTPNPFVVFRIRYNMSTDDYDPEIDAGRNGAASPITDDPYTFVGLPRVLRLNIDTSQFARTFEDRSHVFEIRARAEDVNQCGEIYHVGVRGKRGNIAQTRNAMEYDFCPERLHVALGDCIHFQWSGTNYNDKNNAGNGKNGWDRSNIVQIDDLNLNFPTNQSNQTLFDQESVRVNAGMGGQNVANCDSDADVIADDNDQDRRNCAVLNSNPDPYVDVGVILMNRPGTYHYMSTRNNDYSNRNQKATIIVGGSTGGLTSGQIAGIAVGAIAGAGAASAAVAVSYKRGYLQTAASKIKGLFSRGGGSSVTI